MADIFATSYVILKENYCILIEILLRFGLIDDKLGLVQLMV